MTETPFNTDYGFLREIVLGHSKNVLDPSHDYLFATRLAKLLRTLGMTRVEQLARHLRLEKNPALERAVAEAMTINETSFFRDGLPFDLLRGELLPKLIEARQLSRTLRLWSAGCSTGQEAYSLAMLLHEDFPRLGGWKLRVEGTDLSAEMVERARSGRYQRIEISRGLPERYLARCFERSGEQWVVKPEIRAMCNFRQANLYGPQFAFRRAIDGFDVILLRNVMLYFSLETRRAVLAAVHRLLASDGVLFLGSTEQPADLSIWTTVLAGGACYFQPKARL